MEDCSSKEFDKQKSLSIDLKSTKGFTSETIQNEQINAIPSNSLDFTETFHEAPASNNTDISIKKEPEKSINACEEIKNIIETIPKVTDNDQLNPQLLYCLLSAYVLWFLEPKMTLKNGPSAANPSLSFFINFTENKN